MAWVRELVSGERYSTTKSTEKKTVPVRCEVCPKVAEYQKTGVMEGTMEVCGTHKSRPVWKVRGMRHTLFASGTQGSRS